MRLWAAIAISGVASRLDRVAYWLLADRPKPGGRPVGSERHPAGRHNPPPAVPAPRLRLVGGSGNPWHPTRYRHSRNQAR